MSILAITFVDFLVSPFYVPLRMSKTFLISGFLLTSKAASSAFDVNRKPLIECFFTRC